MRRARTGRMLGATVAASVTVLGLSACFIPAPPPVPTPPNADPIVQGSPGAADVREGFIATGGSAEVVLEVEERSAVVIGATSPDSEDLTLRLTGAGADLESDDGYGEVEGFAFAVGTRDPLLGTVLDPGTYRIELAEFGGDSTSFQLQVVLGTTVVTAGETADLEVVTGQPAVVMVTLTSGSETIAATADFNSALWAQVPDAGRTYADENSGSAGNPLIALGGEQPQDIAVVVSSSNGDEIGAVQLSVE